MRIATWRNATTMILLAVSLVNRPLSAGDWPQILGPQRNGRARGERLLQSWPNNAPRELWSKRIGEGYAGPAVAGNQVVIFHRRDGSDRVESLDAKTGKRIWAADFRALYRPGVNPDSGPRCVPILDAARDRVFVHGAAGRLHCLSLSRGKKIWSRSPREDYRAEDGYFGAGSTPIIAGDKLLVNVGGFREQAGLVALDVATGQTVWKATEESASYSSPILTSIADRQIAIFVTRLNAVGLEPSTGKVRFRFAFGMRGPTVNAATPLVFNDHLFLSASYGVGARLVDISTIQPKTVWSKDDVMSSQYTTCVERGGYLYGTDGREDVGRASLRCIEAMTGNIQWSEEGFGVAHVILAQNRLMLLKTSGQLVLAEASPQAFRPLAEARVLNNPSRALPALSRGRLYLRDTVSGGGRLKCLEVGLRPEA